jgi:hypothetical protein
MLTDQQQLQCRQLLVNCIPLLVQYFLRQILTRCSRVHLQFKRTRVHFHLGLGVPHSLHLIRCSPPTTLPKMMKSVCAKTKPQWKLSKETKGKQSLMQTTMMNANPKYVRGEPVLTTEQLHEAGQYCVELHNYYIMNYKTSQEIIIQFKDRHFLVGDDIFVITFSDLYKLFNLDTLDISLMHCFTM